MLGWGSMVCMIFSSSFRSSRSDGLAIAAGRHVNPSDLFYFQFWVIVGTKRQSLELKSASKVFVK